MPTALAALHSTLSDEPPAGFALDRIEKAEDALRVTFRFRSDPVRYSASIDAPSINRASTAATEEVQGWATEVRSRLAEALQDGWVSRARRTVTDSGVTLSVTDCATVVPPGYQLGDVAVRSAAGGAREDAGWWLATEGFTVAPLQRSAAVGSVVAWVAGSAATELAAPTLAHAAVVVDDDGAAVLHLEARPHVASSLATACAYRALRTAAEAGVESVRTSLDAVALAPLHLRATAGRPATMLLADLPVPDLVA
ncbi:hypothetical protein [uncultured Amnibacterium sp.]|uniref:hypothetical protein n=1 Tax=uncultured Amnibacterium sp. TaxID=1631851 RepID=UPI0035CA95FB